MRSHSLSTSTNRLGLWYIVIGGGASLAANLAAGETLGWKLLGVLAVIGFILGEIALDKIEARPVVVAPVVDDEMRAKRSAAARKAAATRKANAAKAKAKPRSRKPKSVDDELVAMLEGQAS
jgi:hypothetical protein